MSIRIRCWLNQERQGHGRFVNVEPTITSVKDLRTMISERFEVGDNGAGSLFADEGEILVEDVSILRDGDRVSYVPAVSNKSSHGEDLNNGRQQDLGQLSSKRKAVSPDCFPENKQKIQKGEEEYRSGSIETKPSEETAATVASSSAGLSSFSDHVQLVKLPGCASKSRSLPLSLNVRSSSPSVQDDEDENLTPSRESTQNLPVPSPVHVKTEEGSSAPGGSQKMKTELKEDWKSGARYSPTRNGLTLHPAAEIRSGLEKHHRLEKHVTTRMTEETPLFRNKSKCVTIPLENPSAADYPERDLQDTIESPPPHIHGLMNFPTCEKSLHQDFRSCVMCGNVCPTKRYQSRSSAIVPPQNKGVCTSCDVTVWVVVKTDEKIKWCKGCKNFQPWGLFGVKPHATKCIRCRHQQRERYAKKKEKEAAALAT